MADLAASSEHRTASQPGARDDAHARLAVIEDAVLVLLTKRLARALLLEADDDAEPSTTRIDSGPADSHS